MKSLQELAAIRDRMKQTVNTREAAHDTTRVVVGMATCGIAAGARDASACASMSQSWKSPCRARRR